jgi:gamma-glutamyltranspeptidase/glutathione hydrolase
MDRNRPVGGILAQRRGRGGFVNAIACPEGIRSSAHTCSTGNDPAGAGLALMARGG